MSKKIITIFGGTGAQGGGLARAILNDKDSEFAVRVISRHPELEKAQAIAAMGAEVIAADIDVKTSLKGALEGAYGAYCLSFYWEHFDPEREYVSARNLAEATKEA